jgi:hypothetical protein
MDQFVQFLIDKGRQPYTEDGVILTRKMKDFLDVINGNELIKSAYDFRVAFGLTHKQAHDLIDLWMNTYEGRNKP